MKSDVSITSFVLITPTRRKPRSSSHDDNDDVLYLPANSLCFSLPLLLLLLLIRVYLALLCARLCIYFIVYYVALIEWAGHLAKSNLLIYTHLLTRLLSSLFFLRFTLYEGKYYANWRQTEARFGNSLAVTAKLLADRCFW